MRHIRKKQTGFVLITVMWLLLVLSGITLSIAALVRTDTHLTSNLVNEAKARHLAQAAIYRTVLSLMDTKNLDLFIADSFTPRRVDVFGQAVQVRVTDECAKIDINSGWGNLVNGLLGQSADKSIAFAIGQAILDWRDPDHRRRVKGAEDRDYADLGSAYGARDGMFEAIQELQQIKGLNPALYQRLKPLATVDCQNAGIDPMVAPAAVLAAVPDIEQSDLAQFLKARQNIKNQSELEALELLAATLGQKNKYLEVSRQTAFAITARAQIWGGVVAVWRAVVHITRDPRAPFHIRSWARAADDFPRDSKENFPGNVENLKKIP